MAFAGVTFSPAVKALDAPTIRGRQYPAKQPGAFPNLNFRRE
jgi:hypothetical protein